MTARFEAEPNVSNHFAWLRTRLGLERTYLAWLRTAVSLIGFGFTIVQFFARLQQMPSMGGRTMRPQEPRDLGLALIATGLGVLAIASWQYLWLRNYLRGHNFEAIAGVREKRARSPALFAGLVLALIGIAAFVSVFFHFL
jgi:putative membrane protein